MNNEEDKDLLLKDLCARSPYGVKVLYEGQVKEIQYIEPLYNELKLLDDSNYTVGIEEIKPYLRSMSSMTEKDNLSLSKYVGCSIRVKYGEIYFPNIEDNTLDNWKKVFDWLNAHHFDYRGLISKGLAISTDEFNPYKD